MSYDPGVQLFVCETISLGQIEDGAFLRFIEGIEAERAGVNMTSKGYKVKVNYKAVGDTDKTAQKQALAKVMRQAMQRMRER